jgi:hypothetical protein
VKFTLTRGFRDLLAAMPPPEPGPKYLPVRVEKWPEGGKLRLTMRESDPIRGRVVDEEQKPLNGVLVEAFDAGEQVSYEISDDDGYFDIPVPRGATVDLVAAGRRTPVKNRNHVDMFAGGRLEGVAAGDRDVMLPVRPWPHDGRLTCELRGPGGEPMPGAKVILRSALVWSKVAEATADANGLATFEGLPAAPLGVWAWDPLRTGERAVWTEPPVPDVTPEGQTVVLRFRETVVISGTILDDEDAPVASCRVEIEREDRKVLKQVWTDKKGRFEARIAADEPGPLVLAATCKKKDGTELHVRLPGIAVGEKDLIATLSR